MLRFPNPGSTLSNFVALYTAAFEQYRGQIVNLDDIVQVIVSANLATSSGHMGEEAISRSTRTDRSRDPLYNQLKMYAELFRSLGWLRSTEDSALKYTFTLLGEQVVAAGRQWRPLVEETVLGIAFPSHVLEVRGDHDIRPFATILRTMLACNNGISRDEMIVGPLNAATDRTEKDRKVIAAKVCAMRESAVSAKLALEKVKAERGIQINTLQNYTRWPIAILRDLGWATKEREPYRNAKGIINLFRLTPLGLKRAQALKNTVDLRVDQIDLLDIDQKRALSRHSHFAMMERAGFDLSSVTDELEKDEVPLQSALTTLGVTDGGPLLYSPFQALSAVDSSAIFPTPKAAHPDRKLQAVVEGEAVGRGSRAHLFVAPTFVPGQTESGGSNLDKLRTELCSLREEHSSISAAASAFAQRRRLDTQTQFYPLVTHLLQLIGFRSDYSRAGVNYQRWDACVWLHDFAVPIEIKSPTEEMFLSTKAIRQAIENKVILLSRGSLKTTKELSTLVIGYQIPNERGDMSMLIDDVHIAFGFRIGVLDLQTIAYLAIKAVTENVSVDEEQLSHLKGFLDV